MKNNLKYKNNFKQQKSFLFFGIINFLITNLVLQIFLTITETYLATLISQITNLIIGFFLYGKKVFKIKKYEFKNVINYILLAFIIWLVNWNLIDFISKYNVKRNVSAVLVIPLLVTISFLSQKYYVFRKK